VGRNYAEHAKELGNEPSKEPLIFLKPPSSLAASGDAIVYPRLSERVDFEGELGVVIGERARNIRAKDAASYIQGYTCVNDVTARDLQKKDGQWTRGKGNIEAALLRTGRPFETCNTVLDFRLRHVQGASFTA
jgi:2-keto-4-pentenoate hydratase/2-oxohepta-3-ene-1,7-dioic acid hydratase in catechol pathway